MGITHVDGTRLVLPSVWRCWRIKEAFCGVKRVVALPPVPLLPSAANLLRIICFISAISFLMAIIWGLSSTTLPICTKEIGPAHCLLSKKPPIFKGISLLHQRAIIKPCIRQIVQEYIKIGHKRGKVHNISHGSCAGSAKPSRYFSAKNFDTVLLSSLLQRLLSTIPAIPAVSADDWRVVYDDIIQRVGKFISDVLAVIFLEPEDEASVIVLVVGECFFCFG